jgi:hypothetical protein
MLEWRDGLHGEADHRAEDRVLDGEEREEDDEDRECYMGEADSVLQGHSMRGTEGLRLCQV